MQLEKFPVKYFLILAVIPHFCFANTTDLTPAQGADKGYIKKISNGNCAVWLNIDKPAVEIDKATWDGHCKDGYAEGMGIQQIMLTDNSKYTYTGSLRNGMWNGMGRLLKYDNKGKLSHLVEAYYVNGQVEGVSSELLVENQPINQELFKSLENQNIRRLLDDDLYLEFQRYYQNNKPVLNCSRNEFCAVKAEKEGYKINSPIYPEPLDKTAPFGGWKLSISSNEKSARTDNKLLVNKPMSLGLCFDQSKLIKGQELQYAKLLYPSYKAWYVYLRADYQCEDVAVKLDGLKRIWQSQCTSLTGELVKINQQVTISDNTIKSNSEVISTKNDKITAQANKFSSLTHVGKCTKDMIMSGSLGI